MYSKRQSTSTRSISSLAGPNSLGGGGGEVQSHHSRPLKYPHRLNFYETPPTEEITLEEFEVWAIDRLRCECLSLSFSQNAFTFHHYLTLSCSCRCSAGGY